MARQKKTSPPTQDAVSYQHPEADLPARPEIGAQAHFKKVRAPATYRFDSSLAPELCWDGQNPGREQGEALIKAILEAKTVDEARAAAGRLKALSKPFLNWAGKAERLSFEVPTLPLFVHERLSTKVILETLKGQRREKQLDFLDALFGAKEQPLAEQVLRAYEHRDQWVNRMILGDSLLVMSSLLHYESLGGQVQMIYMDPPYGVKFGSNFQPFVRKRDVSHNDDDDITREPEMVQAYRDTWELGLHSYLTYMRDRLLLSRELLAPSGSIFVQISDENLHHVRGLMDEVFGAENFVSVVTLKKTTGADASLIPITADYVLWYARDKTKARYRQLYTRKTGEDDSAERYDQLELSDGTRRPMTAEEKADPRAIPLGARRFQMDNLLSSEFRPDTTVEFEYQGHRYHPGATNHWKTSIDGMHRLAAENRIAATTGAKIRYLRYLDDFAAAPIGNIWTDISGAIQSRSDPKIYVVQTSTAAIARCLLMRSSSSRTWWRPSRRRGFCTWRATPTSICCGNGRASCGILSRTISTERHSGARSSHLAAPMPPRFRSRTTSRRCAW
jgi:adenine-specific DNA-methyltransferase